MEAESQAPEPEQLPAGSEPAPGTPVSVRAERGARMTPAEAVRDMRINLPARGNRKLRDLIERANRDESLKALWHAANVNAVTRLQINDHSWVHIQIVTNIGLKLLRELRRAGVEPGMVTDYGMEFEDAEVVTVLGCLTHCLGMAVKLLRDTSAVNARHVFEGLSRPGHFAGVATVVLKLFQRVGPDIAVFGQKDAQQVAVIRRMVRDLDVPVALRIVATVRETDGLAVSTRNGYLTDNERRRAPSLHRALVARDPALVEGDLDYLAVVDPDTFETVGPRPGAIVIGAARFGSTRLIDNVPVEDS